MSKHEGQPLEHKGAFEVDYTAEDSGKPVVEKMVILSGNGLLQRGDKIPNISGRGIGSRGIWKYNLSLHDGYQPQILGFVNEFGTVDCDDQAKAIEGIARAHGNSLTIVEFSKQDPYVFRKYKKEAGINHRLVSIDHETAVDLGVALKPDTDEAGVALADEFWNSALCRTLMVVGIDGIIKHIEQLMDQAHGNSCG